MPPSSMPNPVPRVGGDSEGGTSWSKFSRLRALAIGVPRPTAPNAPCAGDGVMLTKSAKLNPVCGVCGYPPGVVIMDDGKADGRDGGVVGIHLFLGIAADAGDGDVAR